MLASISNCKGKLLETAGAFSSKFDGLVSKNIHTTGHIFDE